MTQEAPGAPTGFSTCGWSCCREDRRCCGCCGRAQVRLLRARGARIEVLKLTGAGEPGHPLYLRADLKPFPLTEAPR